MLHGDALRRRDAARREEALLQAYDRALAVFPALAPLLAPLREDHVQHHQALAGAQRSTASPSPALAARTAAEARLQIRALEQATARDHAAAAVVSSRQLAPLLSSLAACEASHTGVL